jgi:CubicO group peptidase (beta-lactamase class C family)
MPLRHLSLALGSCCLAIALAGCSGGGAEYEAAIDAPDAVFANPAVTAADVGWTASTSPDVVTYTVVASASGQPTVQSSVAAPATGMRVSGLTSDVDYRITVSAENAAGRVSSASAAVMVHIPRLFNTTEESQAYDAAAAYSERYGGQATLILRDGQAVYQRYASNFGASQTHTLASGTKSFSCALMLAAEQDGFIDRDEAAANVLTEWQSDPNKSQMSILELLSLQGGLSTNPDYQPAQAENQDTYALALADPAYYAPGQAFIYDPLAFQAFALLFERRSGGEDAVDYLQRKIFEPVELTGVSWLTDAEDHPLMAGGASMTAANWARYGQLMLQNGSWRSMRILPAQGVNDCLTYRNEAYLGYGITWWLNRPVGDSYNPGVDQVPGDGIAATDGQVAPSAPENMVMAAGAGGQRLYLLPTQRLVVVRFAPISTDGNDYSDDEFLARLLGVSS